MAALNLKLSAAAPSPTQGAAAYAALAARPSVGIPQGLRQPGTHLSSSYSMAAKPFDLGRRGRVPRPGLVAYPGRPRRPRVEAASGPFDLSAAPPARGAAPPWGGRPALSEAEQAALLEGYTTVEAGRWAAVGRGTHVRYITTAGDFRLGGYVVANPLYAKKDGACFLRLASFGPDEARQFWCVRYADLAYLYARCDAVALGLRDELRAVAGRLVAALERAQEHARKLERRVDALERRLEEAPR